MREHLQTCVRQSAAEMLQIRRSRCSKTAWSKPSPRGVCARPPQKKLDQPREPRVFRLKGPNSPVIRRVPCTAHSTEPQKHCGKPGGQETASKTFGIQEVAHGWEKADEGAGYRRDRQFIGLGQEERES